MKNSKEVIVIDDDLEILDLIHTIIKTVDEHACIHLFDNTEMALEELEYSQDMIDLIITDYNVPELNGDGFAREAKKITDCPIILYSGSDILNDTRIDGLFINKISKGNLKGLQIQIEEIFDS